MKALLEEESEKIAIEDEIEDQVKWSVIGIIFLWYSEACLP